jgi:ABC-type nickel/cobalt efflux system permease component RcnA
MSTKAVRLGALLLLLLAVRVCHAHPMGNFSINHYAGIRVEKNSIELTYLIDRAEIPTYQEMQDSGIVAQAGDASLPRYLAREAADWSKGITLEINGESVRLVALTENVIFPPGAGGLPTMKIGVVYRAAIHGATGKPTHVHYADANFAGHAGWKEIVVSAGDGVSLNGTELFLVDRSARLSDYPTSLLNSPPQDLEADFSATTLAASSIPPPRVRSARALKPSPGAAAAPQPAAPVAPLALVPNKQVTPRSRFTELMTAQRMGPWFILTAAFLAAGLGALHALEPGHGKTIVAAYLVGSRGRARHAVGLGLLVTAAHTAGVYLLGAVVLYASKYVIPERIYPWLSITSGLIIAVLAGYLLLRAWTGIEPSEQHAEGVLHSHWYTLRRDGGNSPTLMSGAERTVPLRQLLLIGITGGIIPCPAALVVLLSAVSLHRIGFGLFLIVAFSLGLAAVLIAIGLVMVRARSLLGRWKSDSPWTRRWLPIASASAMLLAGLAIAGSALPSTGVSLRLASLGSGHAASFAAIVGLGLVLGMRHSTDPDHVVAVSTIVSRERSVRQGAVIGMMWGFGHTLTIFLVGAAIILFNLTIPPRLGLSMEMAVAGMLVFLGVLNLTGVLQWVTQRLTPGGWRNLTELERVKGDQPRPSFRARFGWYQLLRPLAIGLVHGLAGSAAVALLVLSLIHSPAWAIAYLVVFGLGTVIGMMLMTTVMAIPVALTGRSSSRSLTLASGVVSICFGLFLVYHLGFVDGLFTGHAHWTPE